jgi:hypothetical protein
MPPLAAAYLVSNDPLWRGRVTRTGTRVKTKSLNSIKLKSGKTALILDGNTYLIFMVLLLISATYILIHRLSSFVITQE